MIYNVVKEIKKGISKHFPGNFFLVDKEGILVEIDDNMFKLSGVSDLKEIIGTHVRRFGEEAWQTTLQVIKTRRRVELYEVKDGKTFYVMKIPYKKGNFRGVLGFSIDITKLEQVKQAKREFILNMTHDLRTPFTGVYSCVELAHSITKEEKIKEYLNYTINSAKQWMMAVDNIFEIYKADTIDYEIRLFDIQTLLFDIQALYAAVVKLKGLEFIISCKSCHIEMQYLRLKQILISLVSNAIKFTEKGYIEIKSFVTKKLLTLQVRDTGIGIPDDKQEYIFEQFTKLKPSNKNNFFVGTGLGLYITKQCVEQLGGEITLSSQLGKGSLFQVEIPKTQ